MKNNYNPYANKRLKKIKYSLWVEPGMSGAQTREMFKEVYAVVRKHHNKASTDFYLNKSKERERKRGKNKK